MTLEQLRELEKSPLKGRQIEAHKIGDTLYVRQEGEYFFEANGPITDRQAHAGDQMDSLAAKWARLFPARVTLDLRDPQEFAAARELVDSLIPTTRDGFYESVVDESVCKRLRESGIKVKVERNEVRDREAGGN